MGTIHDIVYIHLKRRVHRLGGQKFLRYAGFPFIFGASGVGACAA
jgi:hypothetical protein